jgi:hypothetical protein
MGLPNQIMKESTENVVKRIVKAEMALRSTELDEEKIKLTKRMDE